MKLGRRELLKAGSIAAACGAVGVRAQTPVGRHVVIDPLLCEADRRRVMRLEPQPVQPLAMDLVRQWRDGLGQAIAQSGASAYVRWDKALIFSGLAREEGLRYAKVRLSKGLFLMTIQPDARMRPEPA